MDRPYIFDDSDPQTVRQRHESAARLWDPGTFEILARVGVAPGWRCLEVGAGTGSVARWLSDRVGPSGYVLATDRDVAPLLPLSAPNLEVDRLDLVADEITCSGFDLVYARMVLEHVGLDIIKRLISPLRPGGVLVVEELSALRTAAPMFDRRERLVSAILQFMTQSGMDPFFGEKLATSLVSAALTGVAAEGRVRVMRGGTPEIEYVRTTLSTLRDVLVAAGALASDECDEAFARLDDPGQFHLGPLMISAWGHREGTA